MDLAAAEIETMVSVAVEDVRNHLPLVSRPEAEATVRRRIDWWSDHARVHNFVGILAAREARAELQHEVASRSVDLAREDAVGWIVDHRSRGFDRPTGGYAGTRRAPGP
jgi:hypothetical protein